MTLAADIEGALAAYKQEVEEIAAQIQLHWDAISTQMPSDKAIPLLVATAVLTGGVSAVKLSLTLSACASEVVLHEMGHHDAENVVDEITIAVLQGINDVIVRQFYQQGTSPHLPGFPPPNSN